VDPSDPTLRCPAEDDEDGGVEGLVHRRLETEG
jgi:hypothetical protein